MTLPKKSNHEPVVQSQSPIELRSGASRSQET
jgi:hypothetical protein